MLFNPKIERIPLPHLRARQTARRHEQTTYVHDRALFCPQKFAGLGAQPAPFRGLENLTSLGVAKKTDFRASGPLAVLPGREGVKLAAALEADRPAQLLDGLKNLLHESLS